MLKIRLYVSQEKKSSKGVKFRDYYTYMNLPVGKGKDAPIERKSVKIKVRQGYMPLTSITKGGYIEVSENDINAPFRYEVTDEIGENGAKTGRKVYPTIWIRGEYKYIPLESNAYKPTQNMFSDEDNTDSYAIIDEDCYDGVAHQE